VSTFDETGSAAGGSHHYEEESFEEPADRVVDEPPRRQPLRWHGGVDLGLVTLRLMLGGIVGVHGAQRLFGVLGGKGIGEFTQSLQGAGFKHADLLAYGLAGAELGGAALLVLGLFTPLAAAAVLAVLGNTIMLQWNGGLSVYEPAAALASVAFALLFAGPGRIALDRRLPWFRRPLGYGTLFLAIAITAVVVVQFVLR
jgi:putative oxidoreductase